MFSMPLIFHPYVGAASRVIRFKPLREIEAIQYLNISSSLGLGEGEPALQHRTPEHVAVT